MSSEVEIEIEPSPGKGLKKRERTRRMKAAFISKVLSGDAKLNKKFDAFIAEEFNPPPSKIPKKGRGHGRPYGGKVVFSEARIAALPETGYASHVAKALGIKRASFQQWCNLEENPLPSIKQGGHRLFRKDVIVKWLIRTGRYIEAEE